MTLPELAEYLRFTRKTLYGLLKQGNIPAIKIGRKWRFDKEVIDNWLYQKSSGIKARILVIDDEETIRLLFETTLKERGHVVVTASTGSEGIECVNQQEFDLVFLDLRLPDIDGAEVFRKIKNIKPALMVIIITGYPDSEIMGRAIQEGPLGVMNKPFTDSAIENAVNSFLHISVPSR